MYVRKYFDKFEPKHARRPIRTVNKLPTKTKQALAKDLDINNIIKRHTPAELLVQAKAFEGTYGDFDTMDMQDALNKVDEANRLFMEVPSEIRARFENNAGAFINYATDQANLKQMQEWGLAYPNPPEDNPDAPTNEPPPAPE